MNKTLLKRTSGVFGIEPLERRAFFDAAGTGLQATYFDNTNFTGASVTRVDKTVSFTWGTNLAPAAGIGLDTYSVRWTGQVKPRFSETYTFKALIDDGGRLWVNHRLLVDKWST